MAINQKRWERRKMGVIFAEWGAKNEAKIVKRCTEMLETSEDKDFVALLRTVISSQPQQIGLDKETTNTLSELVKLAGEKQSYGR